jgi:hypothetical protein
MGHDDLTRRLRAALPASARIDEFAFDADLLARVSSQPRVHVRSRRSLLRAIPAAALAAAIAAAVLVVMLVGGPRHVGGPSSAEAIDRALQWFTPPAGTVLHESRTMTQGGVTTNHEIWQSADDPGRMREIVSGAHPYEVSGNAVYDPATNTIYDPNAKRGASQPGGSTVSMDGKPVAPSGSDQKAAAANTGDPITDKVRVLLQRGDMEVSGPAVHGGTDAWAISLKPTEGQPVWTLWISAADGKPLELRDPSDGNQVARWTSYEVLPAGRATQQLSLTATHPSAHVVSDPDQLLAAQRRLGIAVH